MRAAIQSVLDQTYSNFEIIIVDDGSIDNTFELVDSLSEPRIKYYYQNHSERSAARNFGVSKAKGEFICFLDDDDLFLKDHLETLHQEILIVNRAPVVFRTGMIILSEKGQTFSSNFNPHLGEHPIRFFLKNMVGIHTLCFPREILNEYRFDERWWHFQDTHLLIRVLLNYKIRQIPKYTVIYNRHSAMGSYEAFRADNAEERIENNIQAIRDLFYSGSEELNVHFSQKEQQRYISKKYLEHAIASYVLHNIPLSKKLYKRSGGLQNLLRFPKPFLSYWSKRLLH